MTWGATSFDRPERPLGSDGYGALLIRCPEVKKALGLSKMGWRAVGVLPRIRI